MPRPVNSKGKPQCRNSSNVRRYINTKPMHNFSRMSSTLNESLGSSIPLRTPIEYDADGHLIIPDLDHSVPQTISLDCRYAFNKHTYTESDRCDTPSMGSAFTAGTGQTNQNFYGSKTLTSKTAPTKPLNPKAHSWKSPAIKLSEDFNRMQKLVGFVAPEQFQDPAKPTNGPCDIVPTTLQAYCAHRQAMNKMSSEQMDKNIAAMKEQIKARKNQGAIKSVLGKGGKVHKSGLSPVLCVHTMWSQEYEDLRLPQADWPTQSELQSDGDKREHLVTRCGRYLPPPRLAVHGDIDVSQVPMLSALPFDQTGPIFSSGPAPLEAQQANTIFNDDTVFEEMGSELLGGDLMEEIGKSAAPASSQQGVSGCEMAHICWDGVNTGVVTGRYNRETRLVVDNAPCIV